jgi:FAD/FMN-containing dehydrogenase
MSRSSRSDRAPHLASTPTRRAVLRGAAAAVAGTVTVQAAGTGPAAAAAVDETLFPPPLGPATVRPDDPRYQDLVRRGHPRYVGSPDYVAVVGSTEQVVQAVQEAVRAGRRIAVRSGGHCLEDFVDNPAVRVVIDLSGMTEVYFDARRNAFAVEAGALLEEAYRRLFLGWGVTMPSGWCPKVGAGGHICVGGYGVLSRAYGLVVDHLYAVEVVVVDRDGVARAVVATRDPADPNHDLWWAHTGGGGGNFGVVTRYWLRSPAATGTDPSALLPRAPGQVLDFTATWPWASVDQAAFVRLANNLAGWTERNSAPGGAATNRLYSELVFHRQATGAHQLIGQVFGDDADRQLDAYLAALAEGVGPAQNLVKKTRPYLMTAFAGPNDSKSFRFKVKSGYLRHGFTDRQLAAIYAQLIKPHDDTLLIGSVGLSTYGGQINAVPSDATATATRDAIFKLTYVAAWNDPTKDAIHDAWIREFYRTVYADTGGVPDPRDGAYIGYPDKDLADPAINTSGVPWSTLYYKGNYPRLQAVKARWDPRDVFRHALGIRPA